MAAKGPLDEIPRTSKIDQTARIGEDRHMGTPAEPFSSYMEEAKTSTLGGTAKTPLSSPFEIARGQTVLAAPPTVDTLRTQVVNAQSTLGDVNSYLTNKDLKLK